ncbi:PREDICTED: uncharacterized protein LOC109238541 [Nicotiana attenuata]|uniref:uncharacterized protein LOC109238541 n=1 Tax=Nicotiana attenuata TaxID=49451 RepID=UPI0009047CE4|nr:PREDICTED: uncharacterized protein LOC109238541 [Nicotiana attenuata]
MREHQERVDKTPGSPKFLSKRDVGRFVEQPYSDDAAPHAIPKTFKNPLYVRIYDGTTNPEDHVTHYVTAMKGNDLAKEQVSSILLKNFGEALTGGALTWHSQLPTLSGRGIEELPRQVQPSKDDPAERIRRDSGRILSDWADSRATRKLLSRMIKYPPTTLDEIHNEYYAKVRADEDNLNRPTHRLTSVQAEPREDRRNDTRRDLVAPRSKRNSLYLEKLKQKVKWPQMMRSDSSTRKSDALYEFHQERGHKIEDCIALRQEVKNMLRQEYLKELLSNWERTNFLRGREQDQGPLKPPSPACTIHMIICRGDNASINSVKFTTSHKLKRSITRERYGKLEESIFFDNSNTNGLAFPHYDALVITLQILDIDVRRI